MIFRAQAIPIRISFPGVENPKNSGIQPIHDRNSESSNSVGPIELKKWSSGLPRDFEFSPVVP